jgi:hypothetical protein
MSSRPRRFAAVLLAAALLGGACSDGGEEQAAENPEQAFSDALDAFSDYEGVTFVMSLDADPNDLVEEDTPPEVAEQIVDSSITVSGKAASLQDAQLEVVADIGGNEDAVEFRLVGDSVYARADVRELAEAFGSDTAEIDTAVQQASAMGFDFARAFVDGEWVGIEGLYDTAEQFGVPVQTPDPDQVSALKDEVIGILEQNASVTSEGTDDVGAHLVVSVPLRQTAEELADAFGGLGGLAGVPQEGLQEVPEGDADIDVWVSDGRLVQVELDFVALAEQLDGDVPEGVDRMALRVEIDEFTDAVEAPDDYVAIDIGDILGSIFGGSGGLESSESAGGAATGGREVVVPELGLACSDLESVPPAQIKAYLEASGQPDAFQTVKKECPELF